jgi:hypothetical protein
MAAKMKPMEAPIKRPIVKRIIGSSFLNLNAAKNILQRSPSPFPLPVEERGRGEGPKVTAGDVQQARGKAICTPWNQAVDHFAEIFLHLMG